MLHVRILAAGILLLAASSVAQARVTAIVIDKIEPFADGATFADAGAYERVTGTVKGELDPQDARNRGIVDLDKVPRNARGRVEYDTDFFMLRRPILRRAAASCSTRSTTAVANSCCIGCSKLRPAPATTIRDPLPMRATDSYSAGAIRSFGQVGIRMRPKPAAA